MLLRKVKMPPINNMIATVDNEKVDTVVEEKQPIKNKKRKSKKETIQEQE